MPQFVYNNRNPGGAWVEDGMDRFDLHNSQMAQQQNQFNWAKQAQDSQAALALARLNQDERHWAADKADRTNQFQSYADLTKTGWDREDSRDARRSTNEVALARLNKEPSDFERQKYADGRAEQVALMRLLGVDLSGGGAPVAAPTQFQTPSDMMGFGGAPKSAQAQGPAGAGAVMPSGGFGGLDQNRLQAIAAYQALRNGGSMPDFGARAAQNELTQLDLSDTKRRSATERAKQALDAGDVAMAKQIAAEAGVPLPLPQISEYVGMNPQLSGDLGALTDKFIKKDTDTFGWNPGESDIQNIVRERDRIVGILTSRGYPPEQAMAEANRVVQMRTNGVNDLNSGWTQELNKRIGGG